MTHWIGFDLDGTLAKYDHWRGASHIGRPIIPMVKLMMKYIEKGHTVKIFTARATVPEQIPFIKEWLKENELPDLEITNIKDFGMVKLFDDRCVAVEKNTGLLLSSEAPND